MVHSDLAKNIEASVALLGWQFAELPVSVPGSRIRLGRPLVQKWGVADIPGEAFRCVGFFRHGDELVCSAMAEGHEGQYWRDLRTDLQEAATQVSAEGQSHLPPETGLLLAPTRIVEFDARWTPGHAQLDLKVRQDVTRRLGYDGAPMTIFAVTWGGHLVLMSKARYELALESPIG